METKTRSVACPRCGKVAVYSPANPHRPFCSQHCKLIDLGNWANEEYRVPVNDPAQPETQDETSPQPP